MDEIESKIREVFTSDVMSTIQEVADDLLVQMKTKLRGGDNVIYAQKHRGGIAWSGFVCIDKDKIDSTFLTEVENAVFNRFPTLFKNKVLSVFSYGTFEPSTHHTCSYGRGKHLGAYSFAYSIDATNTEKAYVPEGDSETVINNEVDRIINIVKTELIEWKSTLIRNVEEHKDITFGLGNEIVCDSSHSTEIIKRVVLKFNETFPKFSLIASYYDDGTSLANKFLVQYRLYPPTSV